MLNVWESGIPKPRNVKILISGLKISTNQNFRNPNFTVSNTQISEFSEPKFSKDWESWFLCAVYGVY